MSTLEAPPAPDSIVAIHVSPPLFLFHFFPLCFCGVGGGEGGEGVCMVDIGKSVATTTVVVDNS